MKRRTEILSRTWNEFDSDDWSLADGSMCPADERISPLLQHLEPLYSDYITNLRYHDLTDDTPEEFLQGVAFLFNFNWDDDTIAEIADDYEWVIEMDEEVN